MDETFCNASVRKVQRSTSRGATMMEIKYERNINIRGAQLYLVRRFDMHLDIWATIRCRDDTF